MSDQNGFGTLEVGIAGHHSVAGLARLFKQRLRPSGESLDDLVKMLAYKEAQVRGDLFIAAAAGVKFKSQRADALNERQFDEVMNVFGCNVIAHLCLARFGFILGGDGVKSGAELRCFILCQDVCRSECRCVRFAGRDLLGQQPPVEGKRPLPGFKLRIQRLAKAA